MRKRTDPYATPAERFDAKFVRGTPDDCWLWLGAKQGHGYGAFMVHSGDGTIGAHRFAWTRANGPIPEGMHVLHRCDTPSCVNPAHLFLGTHAENMADRSRKGRQARLAGELAGMAKLNDVAVRVIRHLHARGVSTRALQEAYGITKSTVCQIVIGDTWRHIGGPLRARVRHGRPPRKLTASDAADIRQRLQNGERAKELAHEFGIDQSTVSGIKHNKLWRHANGAPAEPALALGSTGRAIAAHSLCHPRRRSPPEGGATSPSERGPRFPRGPWAPSFGVEP